MKKFLLVLAVVVSAVTLTGCGKDKKEPKEEPKEEPKKEEKVESKFDITKYDKEVEKYTVEEGGKKYKLETGYAKDAGYKKNESSAAYMLKLENEKDTSKIQVEFYNTKLETSKTIFKKEKEDFDESKIKFFNKLNINGNEGWEVLRINSAGTVTNYEAQLFFGEEDGKVRAAKITVTVNSTTEEGKKFDFEKLIKSDDFQYLLYSMKVSE